MIHTLNDTVVEFTKTMKDLENRIEINDGEIIEAQVAIHTERE